MPCLRQGSIGFTGRVLLGRSDDPDLTEAACITVRVLTRLASRSALVAERLQRDALSATTVSARSSLALEAKPYERHSGNALASSSVLERRLQSASARQVGGRYFRHAIASEQRFPTNALRRKLKLAFRQCSGRAARCYEFC